DCVEVSESRFDTTLLFIFYPALWLDASYIGFYHTSALIGFTRVHSDHRYFSGAHIFPFDSDDSYPQPPESDQLLLISTSVLCNAISRSHLAVYYPHLLVHPDYQGRGIGTELMHRLMARYEGFHQHMLTADGRALDFYRKLGFERAGQTEPMWIYAGHDH